MRRSEAILLLALGTVCLAISGIAPYDRTTWFLEVAPIFVAVPILLLTARRFPLTPLVYRLIFVHAVILMVGGHYTYARVPLGQWLESALHLGRNPYDRIGHFAQGFVPALVTREVLLRCTPLVRGKWLFFLVTCVCLSVSASYELVEWWAAVAGGSAANDFLGTQGDVWDTQWDMFTALVGALVGQLVFAGVQDRQLARLNLAPRAARTAA